MTAAPSVRDLRGTTTGVGWLPGWAAGSAALALCLALAVAMLWNGLFRGEGAFPGIGNDPALFMWDLGWVPFALTHHLNPLVTNYIHYPGGANLMWNTSIVFPALVMIPVTELFGPVTSYNVLTVLAVALSAWCAFLAVRRYTARWLPAVAGGLIYGFSPYMVSQALGHTHLDIAVYPPLALILADEILVRQRRPPWLLGILLGIATAAQLLTGEEVLTMTVLMAVPALAALAFIHRAKVRPHLGFASRAAAMAALTFVVLAAYPLYIQFAGPQRVSGLLQPLNLYVARPNELVQPSVLQLVAPLGQIGFLDSGVYLGLPLIAVALATLVWLRRRTVVVVAAVVVACALVLSEGGRAGPILLPWAIANHMPVLDNVLPVRLLLLAYLALAVMVGVFLDAALAKAPRGWAAVAVVATIAVLVSLIPAVPYPTGRYTLPSFFTDGSADRLSSIGSVLMTPYYGVDPLVCQAASGMAFRNQLGLVYTPSTTGPHWSADPDPLSDELDSLVNGGLAAPADLAPTLRQTYLADLRAHDVRSIVVGPSTGEGQVVRLITQLVGASGVSTGGVVAWFDVNP